MHRIQNLADGIFCKKRKKSSKYLFIIGDIDLGKKRHKNLMSWYKKGLFFKCKKCGRCCTGFSGFVWLLKEEIENISSFLKISREDFLKIYTVKILGKISLKETSPYYSCIFFKNNKCIIYKARPIQCKTYPFWPTILSSEKTWKNAQKTCPGMLDKKNRISKEEIAKILKQSSRVF